MTRENHYFGKIIMLLLALACLGILRLSAQVNLTNGLVAYYPFNGNTNDASGNNNNGTASGGAAPTSDRFGTANAAYGFGGTGSPGRITIPNSASLQFSSTASFSFWAKLNSNVGTNGFGNIVAGGDHCFFAKDGDAGGGLFHNVNLNGTTLSSGLGNVNMSTLFTTSSPYSVGQWVHICYVMDVSEARIYLNGNLWGTQAGLPYFGTMNGKPLVLGRYTSNWYPLNGALDEFRVYNRVLNPAEISTLADVTPMTITITSLSATSICAGQSLTASFSASVSTPLSGNVYTLQLSDLNGNFTYPITLGSITSTATTGTFTVTVPEALPSGAGYQLRIIATAPSSMSAASTVTVNGVLGDIPSPASFQYVGSIGVRHYFVSTIQQTWSAAQTTCQQNGGNLASIPDAATNVLIAPRSAPGGSHMGLTDAVQEGTFVWTDGSPVSYTNWNSGEPNNSGNEDYGQIASFGKWNDINNVYSNTFFLQLKPVSSNSPLCQGSTLTLFAATLAGGTYAWSGPNGFTSAQQNPVIPNATTAASGTYTLTYTKNGCTATLTTDVTVTQGPNASGQSSPLPASLAAGLILHYPMNGNANDASGNNLNGTIYGGVSPMKDRFDNLNSVLLLNGTNGYIDVPDGIYFNGTPFTVNCWVRVSSYATWSRLFDFGNGPSNNNVLVGLSNGTTGRPAAETYINTASGGQITSPATQVPLNQWAMLTLTWTGGTGRVYINGTQVVSGAMGTPVNIIRTLNYIGRSNWSGDAYANAGFDDFRMYNRVLNSSELQSLLLEQPENMDVSAQPAAICPNTSTTIRIIGSQIGASYQLQNALTSANIGSPVGGNGDTITIATGTIAATMSFQVLVTVPGSCQQIIGPVVVTVITPGLAPAITGDTACAPASVTLTASGAPVGAVYYWYTAASGGSPFFTGPVYITPTLNSNTTYYVSIYANGCESNRTPVTAVLRQATAPAVDLYSDLIAYYKLDNNLADSSGYGYNGTPVSVIPFTNDHNGQPNKAASLDGNNYISFGNPWEVQALTSQVTFAMWINENQANYGYTAHLMNKWQNDGLYLGLDSYYDGNLQQQMNRVRWRVNAGYYVNSNVNVQPGQWTHIVCTYDGSRLKVYQNGILTADAFGAGTITNTIVNLEIGRQANGLGSSLFNGLADEARIYKRALNADEAMALYNEGSVAFGNDPVCAGDTLQLSAPYIAGASYAWSGPNGFSSSQQQPPAIPNASAADAGWYSLIINNPNGCSTSPQTHLVVVNPLPGQAQTVNDTVCSSGNAVLTATGGSSYAWYNSPMGGTLLSTSSTLTINNLTATDTFYVALVSASGCEGPLSPVIAVFNNPVQTSLSVSGSSVCQGSNATVIVQNAQPGVFYQAFYNSTAVSTPVSGSGNLTLTVNTGSMSGGANSISIVAQQPACGSLTLADTATVNIIVPAQPVISASGTTSFCTGDSVTLTASAGQSYLWSNGALTPSITVTQSGTYSVTVTYASGCSAVSAPVTVTVNSIPVATITANGPATFCQGGSVTLNAGGGTNYLWSSGATTASLTVAQSGTYYVIAGNGSCTDTSAAITVTVHPLPAVNFVMAQDTFCSNSTPVPLSGGSPAGGSYSGPGVSGGVFTPSQAGLGFVAIAYSYTDTNGCSNTSTAFAWVDICSGIENTANETGIHVFPNPAGASIEIAWNGMKAETLELLDCTGRLLLRSDVRSIQKLPLDISVFSPGVYFVQLNGAGESSRVKFVKY